MLSKEPLDIFPRELFPVEVFPYDYESFFRDFADAFSVPEEAVAIASLTLLSSAIGNSIRIEVKEGWEEPVFLWFMLCGHTGCGKTPFVNKLLEPVRKKEAQENKKFSAGIKMHQMQKTIYDKLKKSKMVELPGPEPVAPQMTHVYMTDTTLEALANAMTTSPKGLLLHHDELSGLIRGHDQYKGRGNDRQKYLELWSCKPWKIHRVSKPTAYVQNTGCSILGGIQPLILPTIFRYDSFADGLLPRFLICDISDNSNLFSYTSVPTEMMEFWSNEMNQCYSMAAALDDYGNVNPTNLAFDEDAQDQFRDFHDEYKKREKGLPPHAKGFVPKLISYCVRIAGLMAVIHHQQEVNVHMVRKAIKITDFFAGEAMSLLGYYAKKPKAHSVRDAACIKVLSAFQDKDIKNGKIKLTEVREKINQHFEKQQQMSPEEISAMVKKLGFKTKVVGGYSHLVWDKWLLRELTSTTSTENKELLCEI